jgi:cyclic beta-1,2-glucan synthetase
MATPVVLPPSVEPEARKIRPTLATPFSPDQLESHAVALAERSPVAPAPQRGRPLLPRLDSSAERLERAYRFLSSIARTDPQPVGSEDWLRDNYHVVQDQVREIRQDLPRKYYIELPKLAGGPSEGYPRVYLIARELVSHTAGRLDPETLVDFVAAYQRVSPLSIGEVWAIPIMLRLALVEELRRLADSILSARLSREHARRWEALSESDDPKKHIDNLLDEEREANRHLSAAFVVELLQWLRDQPSSAAPVWAALERALDAQGDTVEELVRVEHQREAADQLATGNVITSMRLLSSIDWPVFFDRVSLVEQVLRADPAGAYAEMDFPTRDRYRHSIEQLAKRSKQVETAVAQQAVELARHARTAEPDEDRAHHVGYYLISRGRLILEERLAYSPSWRERFARFFFRHPALGYLGTSAVAIALIVASLVAYANRHGATALELWLVAVAVLIPASELAISLINAILTSQIPPRQLPKLEMRGGIPQTDRTFVVVPAIVDSESRMRSLFHDLEVRFLANQDANLFFALLTDFTDGDAQHHPADEALLRVAHERVAELNERHGAGRFFLFHRERRWNDRESRWMGWERKRGKLAEFNRLLRGAEDTSFVVQLGDLSVLRSIKYVITLDSDTQLPMDTARRLVGTLSHPLNRPRFDARLRRVTEGYGVLQPRVGVSLESASRTSFARVFSGHVGIDPYTSAVSDVYQDLFHEGSFVGKGIYDVGAFTQALDGRVPENTLLSHDLFEGFYARTGLCTDIHVVDDYPSHYLAFAARLHRWVRGDWQIVRWLWRTVPDVSGRAVPNTLPAISRWKILDNLRRSLLPPALVALFVAGWTVLPGSAWTWSTVAFLVLAFPTYTQVGRSLSSRISGVPLREHVLAERDTLITSGRQALLSTVFLLHQSWVMLDAIGRTLVRLLITRRRLLEWVTADRTSRVQTSASAGLRSMVLAPCTALVTAIVVAVVHPDRFPLALFVLALWFFSPAIAHATGQPMRHRHVPLDRDARAMLRSTARRTWRFFDDLAGPADNWLIPDNIQEDRRERIAHRTSPTNIGLQLLSTLAARDFGYLTTSELLARLEPTFETLLKMPRYRGHFYNWYDTTTLAPLPPAYISTVDSGNLSGYFMTLGSGLAGLANRPLIDVAFLHGLRDVLDLCEEELARAVAGRAGSPDRAVKRELARLRGELGPSPSTVAGWTALLNRVGDRLAGIGVLLHELEDLDQPGPAGAALPDRTATSGALAEAVYWHGRAAAAVAAQQRDLHELTAWLEMPGPEGVHRPPLVPTLGELVDWCDESLRTLRERSGFDGLREAIERACTFGEDLTERAAQLRVLADDLVEEAEFGFLFNRERKLFSIGFSVADGRLDPSHYDTLASEARLASFVAIATGAIPHEHWFKLGRSLTPTGTSRALLSWSASMFEYLMPVLVMRPYPYTLLDETYEAIVNRQVKYGASRGVPWGISESAYNVQDLEGNYQYRAFGVPGLGLKRGLADDLVVAPYATILAALVSPADAVANLKALGAEGMNGIYGYYEAIDYTSDRTPKGQRGVVLRTYMAHHMGMSLIALDNVLNGSPMQRRFHADPRVQAADLLLQERIPHVVPLKNPPIEKAEHIPSTRTQPAPLVRHYVTPHTLSPRAHLLSNGDYAVMVTNAGGGYSRRQALALTRWREDVTCDDWGSFCYVRDLESGDVWSTTFQPTRKEPQVYDVTFAPDRALFRRIDFDLEVRTEIVVSTEDAAELRRVSVTNHSGRPRTIDLTSYAEVVLAPGGADLAHPAFSNLFVETTAVPERDAVICTRRPREGTDRSYLIHVLSGRISPDRSTEFETDRARFIGRGRTLERPVAMGRGNKLSGTSGPVLDPIVSLRQSLRIPPGGTARLSFTTGYADSEEAARRLIDKYHDRHAVARALALAGTHSQIELRHLGLTPEDTLRFQRMAGRLMYADPRLRASGEVLKNTRTQADLWKYGISGDLPILLVRIGESGETALFRELLKAHEYLRIKGLAFDLVTLNEHGASYLQDLQDKLAQLVESGPEQAWIDRPGGVFLRRADLMPEEDRVLLRAAARMELVASDGGLVEQLKKTSIPFEPASPRDDLPRRRSTAARATTAEAPTGQGADLDFYNGNGGFTKDGGEYVIDVNPARQRVPPVPWVNVVANDAFGFAATDSGTGFTWSGNSHDNRLTPWSNDPVRDPAGEAVFIRDDEGGRAWSATPLPAGDGAPYTVRHGHGQSTFEHKRDGIASALLVFVPPAERLKIFKLTLRNDSPRPRRLSVTLYVNWVLGEHRTGSNLHVVTSRDAATGAILAHNRFRLDFGERIAFLDLSPGDSRTVTGDRTEFIGRNGTLARPAALERDGLSNRVGAGLDPCGAVQVTVVLEPRQQRTLIGLLGDAENAADARHLIERYRTTSTAGTATDRALEQARGHWTGILGTVQVRTPDRSLDLMLNGWLLYQTLACRFWGRSAFYQSSGAYGFRDQLQDVLALIFAAPQLAREHLLRAAAHQFVEGDVLHWWHEPSGRGVRTRFADDRLWLSYATLHYVSATGDLAVLEEQVPFLEGRLLNPGEHEAYERFDVSTTIESLYQHCVRAIARSLDSGAHGLPLMGGGDWNDGMNLVGIGGQGESVWLAWFLISILNPFADLAESRGDRDLAATYRQHAARLTTAAEEAWDGAWYRRAYFDDGSPLGASSSSECRIDAIAQSWAVIAGTGDPERARRAMASSDEHLVRRADRLILLLTPPFDRTTPSPGYIQGYVPGVRENGGQYTHAAIWTVLAFALLGDGDRAMELFALINPVNHGRTPDEVKQYRAEPYVVAADVYSRPPHTGRGGWTWYTGSAGWMYRVGLEAILGLTLRGGALHIDPCIPRAWPGYEMVVKIRRAEYRITVENPDRVSRGVRSMEIDGQPGPARDIPLAADGGRHDVNVVLG